MASNEKNFKVKLGVTTPKVDYTLDDKVITAEMLDLTTPTLSYSGSAGQLFSISDDLTGTIFSVNDISGIPSIEVNADGTVSLAEFDGNVGIGTSSPTQKLDVAGAIRTNDGIYSSTDLILGSNDTAVAYVKTSGEVGIGVDIPTNTLDVNGTFRARTVNNATGDFATVSATGVLQKRTAAQTLSDIGAAASSHTHGNITNAGAIGTTSDQVVTTTTSGVLTTSSRSGIDSRSTFPPSSHTHPVSEVSDSTTLGQNLVKFANPGAIRFIRINADNTVTARTAADFRSDIGAGTSSTVGTVTSVGGTGTVAGITLSGTVTSSGNLTLGGALSTPVSTINDSTTVGQNLVKLTNPSAIRFIRINADNSVSALDAATFRGAIGAGTSSTTGTVTSVAAGNGLDFTTITGSGSVTLGTPGTVTGATTNSVTATSHTHAVTLTASDVGAAATSHTHGNITSAGAIGTTADLVVTTTTSGVLTTSSRSGIDSRSTFPPDTHTHAVLTAGTGLTSTGTYDGSTARTFSIDSTVATLTGSQALTNKTYEGLSVSTGTNTFTLTRGTSTLVRSGAHAMTLTTTGATNVTFPTTGTLATTSQIPTVNNATLTLNTSGTGLSGSQTFTANQSSAATFTVTSNATNANTASTIVARDGSGNFSAGTITATLSGTATQVSQALTTGDGLTSGGTFNGATARTITLGTPSTLTGATTNSVTASSHTHAVTLALGDLSNVSTAGASTGNAIVYNGASWAPAVVSGGGGLTWSTKTANYTAVTGDGIMANTTSSSWTLTLPASPALGDTVAVIDSHGTFPANNLIIARNGQNIQGAAEDLEADISDSAFELVFTGATDGWKIKTFPGSVPAAVSPVVLYGTGDPPDPSGIDEGTVYFKHEA